MSFESLPKVELHVHLAGTIEPDLAVELARRHGIEPATLGLAGGRYPAAYRDLAAFLELYGRVGDLVRTAEDLHGVAAAFARGQAAQGVAWTEVITPIWPYLARGMKSAELWDALADGLASGRPGAEVGVLIEAFPGSEPSGQAMAEAVDAASTAGCRVVGVGLMGVGEMAGRRSLADAARAWRAAGLGLQVHAGEVGPPENVAVALDDLGADRIAHGITIVRDPAVRDRVIRDRVVLDMCPSSNVAIAGVPALDVHPLVGLWHAGATITISTDDPPFVGATLTGELDRVGRLLGLVEGDQAALQRRTLDASFAPTAVRADVADRIHAWLMGRGG